MNFGWGDSDFDETNLENDEMDFDEFYAYFDG
ncbi:hypothetical protein BH11BAC6_BH11BAC6_06710 [soil metagenome]